MARTKSRGCRLRARQPFAIKSYSVTGYQAPASIFHYFTPPFYLRSSWLSKQPNTPRILHYESTEEMLKIIKYYPKRISSLKKITLAYDKSDYDDTKNPYRKILSKYKKDFFRYVCLDLDQDVIYPSSSVFLKSLHKVRVLSIHSKSEQIQDYEHFPKIVKHNKFLSTLQLNTCNKDIDEDGEDESFRLKWLRYLPNLKSLQLRSIPAESSHHDWKRSLRKTELLTLFSQADEEKFEQLVKGLKSLFQLSSIKKVNFELDILNNKVLESIPFDDLKNKDIAYDLRIKTNDTVKSRKVNFAGLSQTDFLGISCFGSELAFSLTELNDPLQLSSVNLQQQAKNLFFLSGASQSSLNNLIKNCQNIITLDLTLSGRKGDQRSLPNLDHLTNLHNLSLRIIESDKSFDKQWKTLADFAQKHNKLTYLSLNFEDGSLTKESCKNIGMFFEHLKDSLTTLLLSFVKIKLEEESFEMFSQSISNFQKLKDLYLNKFPLAELLKTSIPSNLEELKLWMDDSLPMNLLKAIYKGAPKLSKMCLSVKSFEENTNFSTVFSNLKELKELELVAYDMSKKNWNALVKALPQLNNLEILKVANWDSQCFLVNVDEAQIQQIIKSHPNLKLVALGWRHPNSETLRIVVQKGYLYNIDSFLCGFKQGLLDNVDYKVSYI